MSKFTKILTILLIGWLCLPSKILAIDPAIWQIKGSQNELWTMDTQQVTGYSQHHNISSFLVTDPTKIQTLTDFNFSFRLAPLQGVDHNFVWNFTDEANYYQAHFNGGALWLSRLVNNQEVLSVAEPFTFNAGQTYAVQLSQIGAHLTLKIDGSVLMDFDDLTHDNQSQGSVGFKLSPGTVIPVETQFTSIKIEDLGVKALPVQSLKQNDGPWQTLIYDTATNWSTEPTISRWGCAVTSLAMIFRYHQLNAMPDSGELITPATINDWLLSQEDGYVGNGLVNWFAMTRLSREMSDVYAQAGSSRPKLEFEFADAHDWLNTAAEEIKNNRPLIAQVPGHFVTVHGFDLHRQDLNIRDPFYNYTWLGEHPDVLSLRLFRPSFTDLSALLIVHRVGTTAEILDETGTNISQTWQEEIIEPVNSESTEPWQFTVVSKPNDDQYLLKIAGGQAVGDAQIFTYDQLANVTSYTPSTDEYISSDILQFSLDFNKEAGGQIYPAFTWALFSQKLETLHENQQLTDRIYTRLGTLTNYATAAPETTWPRYKNYLIKLVNFYTDELLPETSSALLALLN